jgi:hypothetical protein
MTIIDGEQLRMRDEMRQQLGVCQGYDRIVCPRHDQRRLAQGAFSTADANTQQLAGYLDHLDFAEHGGVCQLGFGRIAITRPRREKRVKLVHDWCSRLLLTGPYLGKKVGGYQPSPCPWVALRRSSPFLGDDRTEQATYHHGREQEEC